MKAGYNSTLDVFRLVMAVFVVLIHVLAMPYEKNLPGYEMVFMVRGLFDIAVPLFFALIGYLLIDKVQREGGVQTINGLDHYDDKVIASVILKQVPQYVLYYLLGSVLYVTLEIYFTFTDKLFLGRDTLTRLENEYFTIAHFFDGSVGSVHLWFLTAAIYALLLIYLFSISRFNIVGITIMSLCLFIFSYLQPISALQQIDELVAVGGIFFR